MPPPLPTRRSSRPERRGLISSPAPYGPDRFHPSTQGTYLAALVVAAQLRGRTAVGLQSVLTLRNGETVVFNESDALSLQRRADAAIAAYAD